MIDIATNSDESDQITPAVLEQLKKQRESMANNALMKSLIVELDASIAQAEAHIKEAMSELAGQVRETRSETQEIVAVISCLRPSYGQGRRPADGPEADNGRRGR